MNKISSASRPGLPKAPTGIPGLDEITAGGIPRGRPTLVCGSTGCGKTLFAMEFIVRGATQFNEPGVFLAFEETPEELTQNVGSLGFELDELVKSKQLAIDFVGVERSEIQETGDYDLEALFIRLGAASMRLKWPISLTANWSRPCSKGLPCSTARAKSSIPIPALPA